MATNVDVSGDSIIIVLWLYIAIDFLIVLCIGMQLGLNLAKIENKIIVLTKFIAIIVLFINIIKLIIFIVITALYDSCIQTFTDTK